MKGNKSIVDVLVLLPEYSERNALVDSALELVRSVTKGLFQFTLIDFPEEDPRFFDESQAPLRDKKLVSHSAFLNTVNEGITVDRGFNTNFDFIDDVWTFKKKIKAIQQWLAEESEDYWYEMDRPEFEFSSNRTLGVYLNPNPHIENINSGQLADFPNVFFVQLSTLDNVLSELHLHLAKFIWTAPFRFLFEHHKEALNKDLGMSPAVILKDNNTDRLKRLVKNFESNHTRTAHDFRYFMNIYIRGVENITDSLYTLRSTIRFNWDLRPRFNLELNRIEIKELSIYIPLLLKERLIYRYLSENVKGLSVQDIVIEREQLIAMLLEDSGTDNGFNRDSAKRILDELQNKDGMRITVSKINKKFEPFISIPKIKSFTIIRVGDVYRIISRRDNGRFKSMFD